MSNITFSGRCGTNTGKTLMAESAFFIDILSGSYDIALPMAYKVVPGGTNRRVGYFLPNGIYA